MSSLHCDVCGIGRCHPIKAALVRPLGDRRTVGPMMVMPDAPAYGCDICGHRFFEHEFLVFISDLLERSAAPPTRSAPRRPEPANRHSPWAQSLRSRYH